LEIIFDSNLSLSKHISSICQTSFYHIRQLRQIRSSIDINSATIFANTLIHSKLDYCNSLYYSLHNSYIHRLQLVQNSLARVVIPSTLTHHHISPVLRRLHCLPIVQRIKFKIASITYKSLHHQQPSNICELLSPVAQSGRRSSSNKLLNLQRVSSISGQRSFFPSAPKIYLLLIVLFVQILNNNQFYLWWNQLKLLSLCLSLSSINLSFFILPECMENGLACFLNMRRWMGCKCIGCRWLSSAPVTDVKTKCHSVVRPWSLAKRKRTLTWDS